jgi:hypothetical protein
MQQSGTLGGSSVWLNGCRTPDREIVPLGVGITLLQPLLALHHLLLVGCLCQQGFLNLVPDDLLCLT